MNSIISSRFDFSNHPTQASDLVQRLKLEFKNSDVYPEIKEEHENIKVKYLDVMIEKENDETKHYHIYLHFGKAPILLKNGSLDSSKENKTLCDPHFLIRGVENSLEIQMPFDDWNIAVKYLTGVEKGELPVL